MNGHVFQLQVEEKRRGQFQETLDQLYIYESSMYKKDIMQLKTLFTELKQPELVELEMGENSTPSQKTLSKEEVCQYVKDKKSLETTLISLYNVIWGQCSKLLQNELKSNSKYSIFNNTSDVSTLLTKIKNLSNKIEENTFIYNALHEAKAKFYRFQQSEGETLADHMRNFKDLGNSVDYHGGDIFFDKEMTEQEMRQDIKDNKLKLSTKDYRTRVVEKSKAVAFIKSANKKTNGKLLSAIRDRHSFKIDVYPKTLTDAYEMQSSHTHHSIYNNSKSKKKTNQPTKLVRPRTQGVHQTVMSIITQAAHTYKLRQFQTQTVD